MKQEIYKHQANSGRFKKGQIPWNKGTKGVMKSWNEGLRGWTKNYKNVGFQKEHPQFNTGKTHFKEGLIPWCKGKKLDYQAGEKNKWWKGDNVGYHALHSWVQRWKGKPDVCEHCGKSGLSRKQIHWANKSGQYKRELTDWIRLCVRCHSEYDGNRNRRIPQLALS